ncbi:hypothetical protein [Nostoc sp. CENA543]|uniref:hypothetical protein n=1 Tax=Nostoc sp. CENA543 TaxID=1869241 RepID=UPI0012FFEC3C|nr:hypothetical protein [Nostoc sp. CENA543]
MKSFKKLSAIALLLCAFAYPSSMAEAKTTSLDNSLQTSSLDTGENVVTVSNDELLLARRYDRRQYIRRHQRARRQYIRRNERAKRQYIRRNERARRQYIRRRYDRRY